MKNLGNSQNIQKIDNFIQKDIHNPKLKFWGVTPVNLLSVSSIIDQFKSTVLFDEDSCVFQEKRTRKRIGTGVGRNGLWYIGKENVALAVEERPKGAEDNILLHHRRLGHPSFQNMSKMYGELFNKVDKRKLVCDACELGKHTRSLYRPSGARSCEPFIY